MTLAADQPDPIRRWRHEVRNAANCLILCTSAFDVCESQSDQLDMVDQIEQSASRISVLLDNIPAELATTPD